jgi:hypothetical protein
VTKKLVRKPKAKTYEDEEKKRLENNQERLWKRIEKAKQPPIRPPAHEVSADGIPIISIGISTTGIDTQFNYRLVERKRDFEDSLFYMLSALRDVITNNKALSADKRDHLRHTRDAFEKSIWRLEKYFENEQDLDLIEATIAAAYEIGAFGGRHPIREKIRTTPASKTDPRWLQPLKEIGRRIFTRDPKTKEEAAAVETCDELTKLDLKKLGIKQLPGLWAIKKRLRELREEMGLPPRRVRRKKQDVRAYVPNH